MDVAINHACSFRSLILTYYALCLWRLGPACIAALSLAVPSVVLAQTGWSGSRVLALPQPGVAPSGFLIEVAGENMHRFGDMPLHVRVSPTAPTFREDRVLTLRVALDPSTVVPRNRSTSYQFTIELPAGSGPIAKTFYLPKWVLGGTLNTSVLEQGQSLSGYSGSLGPGDGQGGGWRNAWMESAQRNFCWIADPGSVPLARAASAADVADLRLLIVALAPELMLNEPLDAPAASITLLKQHGQAAGLHAKTVQEVPTDWRGFDQFQVWITRWSTYRWLAENRPEAELALRQFVRCGGALWLLDADDDQAIVSQLGTAWGEQWFAEPSGDEVAPTRVPFAEAAPPSATRALPDLATIRQRKNSFYSSQALLAEQTVGWYTSSAGDDALFDANLAWLSQRQGYLSADDTFALRLGLGLIVGCRLKDSVPGSYHQWRQMIDQSQEHVSSVLTRGVDPIAGDQRFWNWVIPGVAQPPVYTFIGLLALFVILVGPVAYRKLSRMGRAYLMFFVAPILAAVTTLFLFGYGLIADGLGTQARVREVTWVCDRDGGAMRYWRSTYFAVVRPSAGLRFPAGTRLEPYYLSETTSWDRLSSGEGALMGNVVLSEDSLRLGNGFLPSRQQRQFVAYRPLENAGGLVWLAAAGDDRPRVQNGFDYGLGEAVFCDADGVYWGVDQIAAGGTATLNPLDASTASRKLTDLYLRNRLEPPPGVARGQRVRMELIKVLAAMEPWRGTTAGQRAASGNGVLEDWLQHTLQTTSALRPGTFIALADVSDDCIAVPSAKLVESIHYVIGELR